MGKVALFKPQASNVNLGQTTSEFTVITSKRIEYEICSQLSLSGGLCLWFEVKNKSSACCNEWSSMIMSKTIFFFFRIIIIIIIIFLETRIFRFLRVFDYFFKHVKFCCLTHIKLLQREILWGWPWMLVRDFKPKF